MTSSKMLGALVIASWGLVACAGSSDEDAGATESAQTSASENGPPTCQALEHTIFSCRTRTNELIAVCGSEDLSATTGSIQFRHGSDRLTYRKLPEDTALQSFREVTTWSESSKGGTLRFTSSDGVFGYTVYTDGDVSLGLAPTGVAVTHHGERIHRFLCAGPPATLDLELVKAAGVSKRDI